MKVVQHDDAAGFLAATASFRDAEPVLTNIIGSVAESLLEGREYESELWLSVSDDTGTVVGCAMRTAPWNLAVSPMPETAAAAVGAFVSHADPFLPGVSGPREVVAAVIGGLTIPARPRVTMVEFARVLDVLVPPHVPTQGAPRTAVPSDIDLLIDWLRQFCIDAGLPGGDEIRAVEARIAQAALWLWVRDDEPVAMAGHAPLVTTSAGVVGRIGPVYTPRHLRGRGYASAVTAAVAQSLLPRCSAIMLFSDAANASSNGIYERLGFRTVAEIVETTLR